jgi:glycine/D-amino acid oxidase-like deaminating enzyme
MIRAGKKVIAIDDGASDSASRVAAGIFNPITGRRMSLTWMAEELFSCLEVFYKDAERLTGTKFYHPLPLYRPFMSIEEQNEWMGKSTERSFEKFIEQVKLSPHYKDFIRNPFGGLLTKHSGYVDTNAFCDGVAKLFANDGRLLVERFDESQLQIEKDGIWYRGVNAQRIIYCTGEATNQSRYWDWVPIRPLKGEVLTLKIDFDVSVILNRGVYLVPELWKAGATYNKSDQTRTTTIGAREELIKKLDDILTIPYEIVDQRWAMRPTTPDRRPILGVHPEYPQMAIFNGLGTKGVSLAPYFSGVFFSWLENGSLMNEEVDLNRYKSLYWKSA